jgi:hypothetical protein
MGVVGESVEATVYADEIEVPELGFRKTLRMYAPRAGAPSSRILLGRSFLAHFTDRPASFTFIRRTARLTGRSMTSDAARPTMR